MAAKKGWPPNRGQGRSRGVCLLPAQGIKSRKHRSLAVAMLHYSFGEGLKVHQVTSGNGVDDSPVDGLIVVYRQVAKATDFFSRCASSDSSTPSCANSSNALPILSGGGCFRSLRICTAISTQICTARLRLSTSTSCKSRSFSKSMAVSGV